MPGLKSWPDLEPGGVVVRDRAVQPLTGAWRTGLRPEADLALCVDCLLCWLYCPDSAVRLDGTAFAGFDLDATDPVNAGRIFSFDVAGGCYEESDYDGIGSGSLFAKSALKKLFRKGMTADEAVRCTVEALYDAADDDTATGGPDLVRGIFPVVWTATAEGAQRVPEEQVAGIARSIVEARTRSDSA